MGIVDVLVNRVLESGKAFTGSFVQSIPNILVAILILVLGVLVGKALRKTVSRLLYKLGMARATKVTGFDSTLKRLGYSGNTVDLLADLVKFFVYVFTLALAADALNIQILVSFFQTLYIFLPRIMGFVVVLVAGLIFSDVIATFFERLVTVDAEKTNKNLLDFGRFVSSVSKLFLILLIIIISLYVLGITIIVLEITYAVALIGFVALFVFGAKEAFGNYMSGVFMQKSLEDKRVEVDGVSGIVKKVGRFHTVVESNGKKISIPNSKFMEKNVKEE